MGGATNSCDPQVSEKELRVGCSAVAMLAAPDLRKRAKRRSMCGVKTSV